MTINAITGMPGCGKTNTLTWIAHKAIKEGRPVYSNIMIKGANEITLKDMSECRFPAGSLVLISEAGRLFNARDWKDLPPEVFDLFTLHRHLGLDMVVDVQDFGMIDVNLRRVIELTWWSINYPFLPFYIQHGYYSLEKLGTMKNPDVKRFVWGKRRKIRDRYDHKVMAAVFASRPIIEDRPYFKRYKYKSRFKVIIQKIRIKYKRKKFISRYENRLIERGSLDEACAYCGNSGNPNDICKKCYEEKESQEIS